MKKFLALTVCLVSAVSIFAKPSLDKKKLTEEMYKDAPETVKKAVAECDVLISKAKYESAMKALSVEEDLGKDEDYLIYKRTEVITNWFCYSMMHQMFDIQDFNSEKELYQFRYDVSYGKKEMNFKLRFLSKDGPEGIFADYIKKFGETPRINLAKAQYYYDVMNRYGDSWLKTRDELFKLAYENYKLAIEGGFYDFTALERYGHSALYNREFQTSYDTYKKVLEYEADNGSFWYNIGSAALCLEKDSEVIEYAQNAIKYPEANEVYQLDAYLLLYEGYENTGNSKKAEETLIKATKKYPKYPNTYMVLGKKYYRDGNKKKAVDSMFNSAKCGYENQKTTEQLVNVIYFLFREGDGECCEQILSKTEKLVKKDYSALGAIYFLRAQVYAAQGMMTEAMAATKTAEEHFTKANIPEAIESIKKFKEDAGIE